MPEKNPLEGVTLDQLDLSDPETYKVVSENVDMSDPETAQYLSSYKAQHEGQDPIADASLALPTEATQSSFWERRLKEAQGQQPGLDPENQFGANRYTESGTYVPTPSDLLAYPADVIARGAEYAGAAGLTALDYLDEAARQTGLADLPKKLGIDNQILPGTAIGALGEAFPLGGMETGLVTPPVAKRLTPEQEQAYLDVTKTGSVDDILKYAEDQGFRVDRPDVEQFVQGREAAGGKTTPVVQYKQADLPLEEQPNLQFNRPGLEDTLRKEAEDFVANKPEDVTPDFRQRELPLEVPAQQRSFDFGPDVEPPKQKAINSRDTGDTVSSDVQGAVDYVNEISGDWQNAPSFEIFDNFDDLLDADPDAIGLMRPDGSIAINMANVKAEAKALGVETNDVLASTTFHEGLGHYGLAQRFGDGLDDFLTGLYDNSSAFRRGVDKWIEENPNEYGDDFNPVARAAEEVLSEMSEKGQISTTLMGRIRDYVKGFGRRMGLQLEYSDGEIRSILAQAHSAVVNGKGRDVTANGFSGPRYMKTGEVTRYGTTRRERIKEVSNELSDTKPGETKSVEVFPDSEPGYFRFRHVTGDGKTVTGYYNVEDGMLQDFTIGTESGARSIGPGAIRRIGRDLLAKHEGEATRISGYRVSGARPEETYATSGSRFMKRRTADNDDTIDLSKEREKRDLKQFHAKFIEDVKEKGLSLSEAVQELRDTGKLPLEVGSRVLTPKAKELGQGPWTITGYSVDLRHPDRYGYRVERGTEGVDKESAVLQVSNPEADTMIKKSNPGWDRQKEVNSWHVMGGPVRFMKRRTVGKGSEGPARGSINEEAPERPSTVANYRTSRPIEDILEEAAPEKVPQSWEEWIDEAGNIKMTGKVAQDLAVGTEPAALKAAEKFLLESSNRIFDLSRKAGEGLASEREMYLLGKEIERAKNVSQSIDDVVSNAARILNSRKIEVSSDKALSDGIRNMLRSISKGDLKDPNKVKAFASKLRKGNSRAKVMAKSMEVLANLLTLPRSIMSSMDFSAPLRQGIFFVGRKELWKNVPSMFRQFGGEEAFNAVKAEIQSRPTYPLMKKANLEITDLGHRLSNREEDFISSYADKLPVIGKGVRASERAYTGFLNKLRADVFDDLVRQYNEAGIDLKDNPKALHDVADLVNTATGRGNLGKFTQASPILNGFFFSPRLIASRLRLLNPVYYAKLDPIARKTALKSLASFGGIATTVMMLAKMAGADVEADPRSTDFGKVKVNNTRYDVLGGFGQYLTLASRLATNQKKNVKQEVVTLGEGYGSDTRLDVLTKFGLNKASPVASFFTDYLRGSNAIGEPFEARQALVDRMIPLFFQDAAELTKEEGAKGIPMSLPGLFGVGISTYEVDLGYDAFGRDIKEVLASDVEETDPVVLEVQRLSNDTDFDGITPAPKSFKFEGQKYEMSKEERDLWQQTMGAYTHEYLTEDMSTEDYLYGTDEDKVEIIKEAHRDAYEDTKVFMLEQLGVFDTQEDLVVEEE